jgi:tRNA (guanine37-N1)-methyltransferase
VIPRYDVLTLHPEMVRPVVTGSILGRAVEAGLVAIGVHDIRDHATGKHKQADDTPYGGGAGMVMKVDVVARAIEAVRTPGCVVVLTSPGGRPLTQAIARDLSQKPHVIVVCGHYEGIDARIETLVDLEISLGDFVLTGGEIAAAAIVDAAVRLIPGVLGNEASAGDESFGHGLLEYPHYTRPRSWNGHEVPEVLLSGHHGRIDAWRRARAQERTRLRRPDLWQAFVAAGGRPIDETGDDE